jgi:hypothetical protein
MKKRIMSDVVVHADLDGYFRYSWAKTNEERAVQLAKAVDEFNDFIRDHRSMDWVSLNVVKEYEDVCSHCHSVWETDEEGSPLCCDAAVREYKVAIESSVSQVKI